MDAKVVGEDGKFFFPLMGCYGIGITRIVAAAIEQHHDQDGIVWPKAIAPYQVHVLLLGKSEELHQQALKIYHLLWQEGIETLLDDRKAGVGYKFKDANLLGLPFQLVLGEKNYQNNKQLELVERSSGKKTLIAQDGLVAQIKEKL